MGGRSPVDCRLGGPGSRNGPHFALASGCPDGALYIAGVCSDRRFCHAVARTGSAGISAKRGIAKVSGISPAAPALVLALVGLFGSFFVIPLLRRAERTAAEWRFIGALALLGVVVAVLPRTSYDYSAGRFSGLWNVTHHLPTIAYRSPLIVALAGVGGAIAAVFLLALNQRDRILFAAALALFAIAQVVNANAWQRYNEPFILMFLALVVSRIQTSQNLGGGTATKEWRVAAGPIVLAGLLALLAISSSG